MAALSVEDTMAYLILTILSIIASLYLTAGLIDVNLNVLDGSRLDISLLFKNYQSIFKLFLASLALIFIYFIGSIFLVVPGIIFAVRLSFTIILIVDKKLGVIEAIKASWKMTRGNFWSLFGLFLVSTLIVFLSFLALLVGVLIAAPLIMLCYFIVYKKLLPNAFEDDNHPAVEENVYRDYIDYERYKLPLE